ncbi:MAG TPA: lamin tail domain-containing protein [Gaiellaceae bacterium]|nr:lamin tail domain-containing protein [Gaiellaceae bacterium]
MKITRMRGLAALAAAGTAAGLVAGALAVGSVAAADEAVIHACRHPHGGWVRIVPAENACRAREQALRWNVQGPAGQAGPEGPAGPAGPKGDPGQGVTSLDDLDGIACTPDGGGSGKVELDLAGDDTVLIRCIAGSAPPPPPPPPPPGEANLVINEVDYDQVGADGDGFVEIANTGDTAADLSGIALVFVDGSGSLEYDREALTGSLAAGGYLVVAIDAQNGAPDGLALVETADGTLLDALSYEGAITAAVVDGTTYSLVEGTALAASVADSNTVAGSLSRIPDMRDTNDAAADWAFTTTLTRGAANVATQAP